MDMPSLKLEALRDLNDVRVTARQPDAAAEANIWQPPDVAAAAITVEPDAACAAIQVEPDAAH